MKTGVLAMKTETGFSLCGKLHRENPVLALYWPCTGLQCSLEAAGGLEGSIGVYCLVEYFLL